MSDFFERQKIRSKMKHIIILYFRKSWTD